MQKNSKENKYHHGDLRQALVLAASQSIESEGVESISMRKLGESVGVSRTALYHHFANKNELLSAIAESGFVDWISNTEKTLKQSYVDSTHMLLAYVQSYFDYALANSAKYELMFGKEIWANDKSSDSLHQIAYKSFQYHLSLVERWQQEGILSSKPQALRLAQVTWGTLHGISKLFMDGVYVDTKNLTELAETVVNLLTYNQ